jgi:hypothetical protein
MGSPHEDERSRSGGELLIPVFTSAADEFDRRRSGDHRGGSIRLTKLGFAEFERTPTSGFQHGPFRQFGNKIRIVETGCQAAVSGLTEIMLSAPERSERTNDLLGTQNISPVQRLQWAGVDRENRVEQIYVPRRYGCPVVADNPVDRF